MAALCFALSSSILFINAMLCSPSTIATPVIFGAEILSLSAVLVTNFTLDVPQLINFNHGAISVKDATFCNITVTYTHQGQNDLITVETWLPQENWNERLQATAGGGWQAGRSTFSPYFMAGAIGEGYATTTSDAGLGSGDPYTWALASLGNVDLYALQNLAHKSLEDQAIIGKSLIRSFYGRDPAYSYWNGCSQGGRQGLMLAQRYPTAYDGIAASAPAIYWNDFVLSNFYPAFTMNQAQEYPLVCELEFLTEQAVKHCDPLDGVTDGIIAEPYSCDFDPFSMVNSTFNCSSPNRTISLSNGAALVANAAWTGARSSEGGFLWYGVNPDADISGLGFTEHDTNATANAIKLQNYWINLILERRPDLNFTEITHSQYDHYFHQGQLYSSMIDASDPELSYFNNAGGKMLTFHGLVGNPMFWLAFLTRGMYRLTKQYHPTVHSATTRKL